MVVYHQVNYFQGFSCLGCFCFSSFSCPFVRAKAVFCIFFLKSLMLWSSSLGEDLQLNNNSVRFAGLTGLIS